ncbi:MAG: hypothetical protein GC181_01240 [Bacteroidetes bacterium]|nr:hypothetical protein [Bacteroidota bacterium]
MITNLRSFWMLILFTVMNTASYAQLNNKFFWLNRPDAEAGTIRLNIENLNYFRDVEYKSNIDEGRTLFGYQLAPEINYQLATGVQISGGVFIQKDFGGPGFYAIKPLYSLQYNTGRKTFRFGYLLGSMQHNLIEPFYDPERIIENRLENGFQFLWKRKHLDFDYWIDWQKMIYPNSNYPEMFTTGFSANVYAIRNERMKFSFPVQMLAHHVGGEIDTSHSNTTSQFNFDYATKWIYFPKNSFFDSIDIQGHLTYYEDISTFPVSFIDGLGQYVSAAAYFKHFGVMLNYWDSHQFQSPMGDVIYHSVSNKNPDKFTFFYRKLVLGRVFFQHQISKDLNFLFRTTVIHDFHQNTDDFIGEFYFRWTPTFTLGKIKNP